MSAQRLETNNTKNGLPVLKKNSIKKTWRIFYAPLIADEIKAQRLSGLTDNQIKKYLSLKNPGQYGHMKKIWSDESLKQLGLKKRKIIIPDQSGQMKLL